MERMLQWYGGAYGIRSIFLRYFNAAGADPEGVLGEDHHPEEHLIPVALLTVLGKRDKLRIFGTDWATPDGTCIRDYVHVCDLADAHFRALQALRNGAKTTAYNLGNGYGFSVKEVIRAVEKVTGQAVPAEAAPRRAGDPARLVASSERIKTELGWNPQHAQLEVIIQRAWNWRKAHPDGYGHPAPRDHAEMAAFGPIRTCLEIGASVQSLCHTAKSAEHGGVSNEFKHLDHPLGKALHPVFLLRAAFGALLKHLLANRRPSSINSTSRST